MTPTSTPATDPALPARVADAPAAPDASAPPARPRLANVVGRLALVHTVVANIGIITGPLLARALGTEGRGLLAAIMTPLAVAPVLVSFGLARYATRSAALGRPIGDVLGSIAPALIGLGLIGTASAPFVSEYLSNGNETVRIFLLIGLATLPLSLLALLLEDIALGRELWPVITRVRLIGPVLGGIAITILYVVGELTLTTAAASFMVAGSYVWIPLIGSLRGVRPIRFRLHELREGVSFGWKAWLGGLSALANVRLDQLVMIKVVSPHELGLYVVAVTLATFLLGPVLNAITSATSPRITRGETKMFARSLRVTMASVLLVAICLGAASPFVLRYVFGEGFVDAVPMVIILLVGVVPGAGLQLMNSAVSSAGHPGLTARNEMLALCITIPGLFILLPTIGAIGAAIVSSVAYTATFLLQLYYTKRIFDLPVRHLLLLDRGDVAWAAQLFTERLGEAKKRLGRQGP